MNNQKIKFRVHAIQRMFERGISITDIQQVQQSGKVIENYAEDLPYHSALRLGWSEERPIHSVACLNQTNQETIVITVYEPSPAKWEANFKKRKS